MLRTKGTISIMSKVIKNNEYDVPTNDRKKRTEQTIATILTIITELTYSEVLRAKL